MTDDTQEREECALAARELRLGVLAAVEESRSLDSDYSPAKFGAPVRAHYLLALETHGAHAQAARDVQVTRSLVLTYGGRVPDFVAAEREALAIYRDSLASELNRRARDGVATMRFDRDGKHTGTAIAYSDGLLGKALERADRIVGDLPADGNSGARLDAPLVSRLSPEGRSALRIVLSELAGLVPTESDLQKEGISSAIDVQAQVIGK